MISGLLSRALADQAGIAQLEQRLADENGSVPAEDVHELAELVGAYLAAMPTALDALIAMTKQPPFGRSVAFVAGQVLLYLADEDDLFGEREFGVLGMLDDAYLLHASLVALQSTFPQLGDPPGYAPPDPRAVAAVRTLLPVGVPEALDRSCENLVRVAATLYSGGGQGGPAPEPAPAALRVGDALRSLSHSAS